MDVLGLITARGNSKGIPKKNIVPLAGKPLLTYTCEAAKASHLLSRVLLSTDNEEIAEVGRACGVEAPFLRPQELALDNTPSIEVATHALKWLLEQEGWQPEVLMLLQPTSPLRTATHIDESLKLLGETGADTVVSVVPIPHRFSPYSILRLTEGRLRDFWEGPLPFDRFRRQDQPVLYARNGPVVLGTRLSVLQHYQGFYGPYITPYLMREEDSVDIDTYFDLQVAEALLAARGPIK